MISYELAKGLKDAGFPHGFTGECGTGCNVGNQDLTDFVYAPTLSELIGACGEEFVSLEKHADGVWFVTGRLGEHDYQHHTGSTPSEAVANLWLALNKKDHAT